MIYHPAKDINHCIYRFISVLRSLDSPIALDKLRLIDFYYLFPHLLKEISPWPADIKDYKKVARSIESSFEKITDKRRVFFELKSIQRSAINILLGKGLIDLEHFKNGELLINHNNIPEQILQITKKDSFHNSEEFKLLIHGLTETVWKGANGLKKRSGLMEYRYDE